MPAQPAQSALCRRTNAIAILAAHRRRGLHGRQAVAAVVAAASRRCLLCLEGSQLLQGTVCRCAGAAAPSTTQRIQAFGGADVRHAAAALARRLGWRVPHDGRVLTFAAAALAIAITIGSARGPRRSALLAPLTRCCTAAAALSRQLPVL